MKGNLTRKSRFNYIVFVEGKIMHEIHEKNLSENFIKLYKLFLIK